MMEIRERSARRPVIVSRHPSTVEFIRAVAPAFRSAPVLGGDIGPGDVAGRDVAGNLPLDLAASAASVTAVLFTTNPPRGVNLDAAGMAASGAYLARFVVRCVAPLPEIPAGPMEYDARTGRYTDPATGSQVDGNVLGDAIVDVARRDGITLDEAQTLLLQWSAWAGLSPQDRGVEA